MIIFVAIIVWIYTGFRVIQNSYYFYSFNGQVSQIYTEWLYWFGNMPIWWPTHFILFIILTIYLGNKLRKKLIEK